LKGLITHQIARFRDGTVEKVEDFLAEESPLEIQVNYKSVSGRQTKPLSITMRTPGADRDLALGFMFTEGIFSSMSDINDVSEVSSEDQKIEVQFTDDFQFAQTHLDRNFYTTSSCGVCGKSSIDALKSVSAFENDANAPRFDSTVFPLLLKAILNEQGLFSKTGGIHAAFLFSPSGDLLDKAEDVGRHNALDKLIGKALQKGMLPLKNEVLLLSGRASFELIQKATMAAIPIVLSIGAPSSLAVDLAKENNMTLIGFLKSDSYNVYCGEQRLIQLNGG